MRLSEIGALNSDSIELIDGIACFRVKSDAKTAASANRLIPISNRLKSLINLECLDMGNLGTAVGKRFGRIKETCIADGEDRSKCFPLNSEIRCYNAGAGRCGGGSSCGSSGP